jgi:ABC-type dipeptide/oligopeptide/nickel transport system permease subunit
MSTALAKPPITTPTWRAEFAHLAGRYPLGVAGAFILPVSSSAVAIFSHGTIAPLDPFSTNPAARLALPGDAHPFGADAMGRDLLSRMIHGARISLAVPRRHHPGQRLRRGDRTRLVYRRCLT